MAIIAAGSPAPQFTLRRADGGEFTRADLFDRLTVLVFYPFAFTPVCTDQLSVYDTLLDQFAERGAVLYGVSCDASPSQAAFRDHLGVRIEQLSDFEPKGAASRAWGAYHPGGFSNRALVLTGEDATVRWSHEAASIGELPGANLIFDALERLAE